jgi:hypothetical protein
MLLRNQKNVSLLICHTKADGAHNNGLYTLVFPFCKSAKEVSLDRLLTHLPLGEESTAAMTESLSNF